VGHGDFHKQFAFMRYYLLPNLAWAVLCLTFKKILLFASTIIAVGQEHHIRGRVALKATQVAKILQCQEPTNMAELR
jgi:hypothetical protein